MKILLTDEQKENLATFGIEDISTIQIDSEQLKKIDGKDYCKNAPNLATPRINT